MTEYASLDDISEGDGIDLDGEDFVLPNGKRVRVRGMTRFELILSGKGTEDAALIERRVVSYGLLQPEMTLDQIERWQRSTSAGRASSYAALTGKIRDLSGLGEGADKSNPGTSGE